MKHLRRALSILFILIFVQVTFAQDWANLKRYQEDNANLMLNKNTKSEGPRGAVVFMGNSITESWSQIRPAFFANKPYINRGISGQTTPQMLVRFRQDVIDLQPAIVVIMAGINDIAGNTGPATIETIANNIFSMAELARANNIKVVLCSVLPAFNFAWNPGLKPAAKVIALNALLKSYAQKHKMEYVDYFSGMVNEQNGLKEELGIDSVHPNAAGYAVMEPLVTNVLKSKSK